MFSERVLRYGFRIVNNVINPMGLLLSKPEIIHGRHPSACARTASCANAGASEMATRIP